MGSPERRELKGSPEHTPAHDPHRDLSTEELHHLQEFNAIHRRQRQGTPSELPHRAAMSMEAAEEAPSLTRSGIPAGLGFTKTDLAESDRLASNAYKRGRHIGS